MTSTIINNFSGLVKNKKGPYYIIAKNDKGLYLQDQFPNGLTTTRGFARNYGMLYFDYGHVKNCCYAFGAIKYSTNFKVYLSTAAGDIELSKSDIKPEFLP